MVQRVLVVRALVHRPAEAVELAQARHLAQRTLHHTRRCEHLLWPRVARVVEARACCRAPVVVQRAPLGKHSPDHLRHLSPAAHRPEGVEAP
eukprot:5298977-Prymnesium_polylepis.2